MSVFAFCTCDLFGDPAQVAPDNDVVTDIEADVSLFEEFSE